MRPRTLCFSLACMLALAACSSSITDDTTNATSADAASAASASSAPSEGVAGPELPLRTDDDLPATTATTTAAATKATTATTATTAVPFTETSDQSLFPTTTGPSGVTTPANAPTTSSQPDGHSAIPAGTVIDTRPPTANLDLDNAEEGIIRNGDGNVVSLDEAGSLACAAAEKVLTQLDENEDTAETMISLQMWAQKSANVAMSETTAAMSGAVTFETLLPVLEVCVTEGHEL